MELFARKFISGILLPLPFLLSMMGIGLFLLWFSRRQKTAKTLISLSWLALLLLSLQPVADALIMPLENKYSTYKFKKNSITNQTTADIKYIIVLGAGYTYNERWAPSSNVFESSLPRITEAIRLYHLIPNSKLIFTGGYAIGNPHSNAKVASKVALSLAVPSNDIVVLDSANDTQQEAQAVANMINGDVALLVTSANHMPRALNIFRQQGVRVIAAPANQLAITSTLNPWEKVFPSPRYLTHSERFIYETLGGWWLKANAWLISDETIISKQIEQSKN